MNNPVVNKMPAWPCIPVAPQVTPVYRAQASVLFFGSDFTVFSEFLIHVISPDACSAQHSGNLLLLFGSILAVLVHGEALDILMISLAVEVLAKSNDAWARKDTEDIALMVGEFYETISMMEHKAQSITNLEVLHGKTRSAHLVEKRVHRSS